MMAPRRRCRSSTPATCNHGGVRLGGRGRTTRAHQAGERTRAHPLKVAEGCGVVGNDASDDLARRRTHGLNGEEATEHGRAS